MSRMLRRHQLQHSAPRRAGRTGHPLRKHARDTAQHPVARAADDGRLQRPQLCQFRIHERRRPHVRPSGPTGRILDGRGGKMATRTIARNGRQTRIRRMVPHPAANLQGAGRATDRYAFSYVDDNGHYEFSYYAPDDFQRYAFEYIDRQTEAGKPFLLYYPTPLVHTPHVATPDSECWTDDPDTRFKTPAIFRTWSPISTSRSGSWWRNSRNAASGTTRS